MARQPRFVLPGQPQHVIQRGNNRQRIFRPPQDYFFFLEKLGEAAGRHECDIHAYVLMPNHVHLLVTPHQQSSIAKMMQTIGRYYVQYFNYRNRRSGTLWEGRYKASLIDSDRYLLACMRYIELNPVRAKGLPDNPADYPWSSFRCNALGFADPLITPHYLYEALASAGRKPTDSYRSLFDEPLPKQTLKDIRKATNNAWALGDQKFCQDIERRLGRQAAPKAKGGDRKSKAFRKRISGVRLD